MTDPLSQLRAANPVPDAALDDAALTRSEAVLSDIVDSGSHTPWKAVAAGVGVLALVGGVIPFVNHSEPVAVAEVLTHAGEAAAAQPDAADKGVTSKEPQARGHRWFVYCHDRVLGGRRRHREHLLPRRAARVRPAASHPRRRPHGGHRPRWAGNSCGSFPNRALGAAAAAAAGFEQRAAEDCLRHPGRHRRQRPGFGLAGSHDGVGRTASSASFATLTMSASPSFRQPASWSAWSVWSAPT